MTRRELEDWIKVTSQGVYHLTAVEPKGLRPIGENYGTNGLNWKAYSIDSEVIIYTANGKNKPRNLKERMIMILDDEQAAETKYLNHERNQLIRELSYGYISPDQARQIYRNAFDKMVERLGSHGAQYLTGLYHDPRGFWAVIPKPSYSI